MIIFAVSIALQLAGAILLIENFIPTRKAILIKAFSETGNTILGDFVHAEKNIMTSDRLIRIARYAYQNFCALVMIGTGYILSPFGKNEEPWVETAIIIPIVVVINLSVRKIAKYLSVKKYPENVIVDKNGIEMKDMP